MLSLKDMGKKSIFEIFNFVSKFNESIFFNFFFNNFSEIFKLYFLSMLQINENLFLLIGKIAKGPSFKKYCFAPKIFSLCWIMVVYAISL